MGTKILVIDNEKMVVKGIKFSLEQDGMEVHTTNTGKEALEMLEVNTYDMILMDLVLPDVDGFDLCQSIRGISDVPIIILSAKNDDMDKIMGLEYGADDYITKPFNILEVKVRIKVILRRCAKNLPQDVHVLERGDLKLDLDGRRVYVVGVEVSLTAKEFDLLELMVGNPDKVFSREALLDTIWGPEYPGDVRTVDVHIRRLREKIEENPGEPRYVHTKWGVGYYFRG